VNANQKLRERESAEFGERGRKATQRAPCQKFRSRHHPLAPPTVLVECPLRAPSSTLCYELAIGALDVVAEQYLDDGRAKHGMATGSDMSHDVLNCPTVGHAGRQPLSRIQSLADREQIISLAAKRIHPIGRSQCTASALTHGSRRRHDVTILAGAFD
jgi:hypothetical protein